jgi:hypothetical protein
MKKVLPWWVRWACRSGTRDFLFCLDSSSQSSQKYFLLAVHFFNAFVTIAQQAGQAAVLGHLSHSMFLYLETSQDSSVS